MAKNILVTGRPGIGKTTAVAKVVELLSRDGYKVGGFISREVRKGGTRIGFEVVNLKTGEKGWLARVEGRGGPRVGKYTVDLESFETIGVKALERSLIEDDVIVVDEIGPMELFSNEFKNIVWRALESPKPVIATIHWKASRYSFGKSVLSRRDVKVIDLTFANRNRVPFEIYKEVIGKLCSK